jgi:hypothetical protein
MNHDVKRRRCNSKGARVKAIGDKNVELSEM